MSNKIDIIQTPSEPISEYFGEGVVTNIKNFAEKTKELFNKTVISAKHFLIKIRNANGIRQVFSVVESAVRETPLIGELYKNHVDESLNEKVIRIQDLNDFSECLYIIYGINEVIAKYIYKVTVFIDTAISPSKTFKSIFENENELTQRINNNTNVSIYKQCYELMKDANINNKYCNAFIVMLATMSPFYYVLTMLGSKLVDTSDPEFYNNPLLYNGGVNSQTGFTKFESKLLSTTKSLIDRYNECDNDFEKTYILSKEMLKQTMLLFVSSFAIFVPLSFKLTSNSSSEKILFAKVIAVLQLLCTCYAFIILIINLIYSHLAIENEKKKI